MPKKRVKTSAILAFALLLIVTTATVDSVVVVYDSVDYMSV